MKTKITKRAPWQYGTGGTYHRDNGCVAFGDPLELIGKNKKKRKQQEDYRKMPVAIKQSQRNMHLKHG